MKYQANPSCVIMSVIPMITLLQSIDVTRRNLMLITLRAERVKVNLELTCTTFAVL